MQTLNHSMTLVSVVMDETIMLIQAHILKNKDIYINCKTINTERNQSVAASFANLTEVT